MKNILSILIILNLNISCYSQVTNKNDKELINGFVRNVLLQKKIDQMDNYISYNSKDKNTILFYIDLLNKKVKKNYVILKENELNKNDIIFNFIYNDYNNVYHLVLDKKVITSFIVKNKKIISFFYSIKKKRDNKFYPTFLNNK